MIAARARNSLEFVGRDFGDPSGPFAFAELMARSDEPFELGLALDFDVHGAMRALVSYNPRTRAGDARSRMLSVLTQAGFDVRSVAAAFDLVPADQSSTVLGIEWQANAPKTATLYLEEMSRFFDASRISAIERELARLAAVDLPSSGDPGAPYIVSLEIMPGRARPTALKLYRFVQDSEAMRTSIQAFAGALSEPWGELFTGGAAPSGYILQRRFDQSGVARLKAYKTYPYRSDPSAGNAELRSLFSSCLPSAAPVVDSIEGDATSVGVAFSAGSPRALSVTAYFCVEGNF